MKLKYMRGTDHGSSCEESLEVLNEARTHGHAISFQVWKSKQLGAGDLYFFLSGFLSKCLLRCCSAAMIFNSRVIWRQELKSVNERFSIGEKQTRKKPFKFPFQVILARTNLTRLFGLI